MAKDQIMVYMHILLDTLVKKGSILDSLIAITSRQQRLLEKKDFSMEEFEAAMEEKEILIRELNQLEDGFETLYQRIQEEFHDGNQNHREMTERAQELIRSITEKSMILQAMEGKNKEKLLILLSGKRKEIRSFRTSNQAANQYQYNMSNQHQEGQSYFLDKKK